MIWWLYRIVKEIIFSVVAVDKPGIVDSVSRTIADRGGSWMESRMVTMAGRFAGIIRVECPDESFASLRDGLQAMEGGVRVIIDDVFEKPAVAQSVGRTRRVRLTVIANDRPGIVQEVSRSIAAARGNVFELDTDCRSGAMAGHTMFKAEILVDLPEGVDPDALIASLHGLSDDIMVDVEE